MINILYVTCLFIFFIIFLNKTDDQMLGTETRVCLFLEYATSVACHSLCGVKKRATLVTNFY